MASYHSTLSSWMIQISIETVKPYARQSLVNGHQSKGITCWNKRPKITSDNKIQMKSHQKSYHASSKTTTCCNCKNIKHSRSNYSPNSYVTFCDEGTDYIHEEFWCWSSRSHKRGSGYIVGHMKCCGTDNILFCFYIYFDLKFMRFF